MSVGSRLVKVILAEWTCMLRRGRTAPQFDAAAHELADRYAFSLDSEITSSRFFENELETLHRNTNGASRRPALYAFVGAAKIAFRATSAAAAN